MSTERDIIIERLEQKLAARDKEMAEMQESLRESIIEEIEKRFTDKLKLRESTLDEIRMKFNEKVNEIIEMNKSLRDSLIEQKKTESDVIHEIENRMKRIERRLMELNSSYDGVMKELLDQKSIIRELLAKMRKEEPQEAKEEDKKGKYIIADNPEPDEKTDEKKDIKVKKSENVAEGVEVIETLKKR